MYNITVSCSTEQLDYYLAEYCGSGWRIKNVSVYAGRVNLNIIASGSVSESVKCSRVKKIKEFVRRLNGS